jgi:methionyl-tRNA synthetase
MLLTDVLKRWQEVKGRKAILLTGTDEHGMKIQQAAAKANTDPKTFCDKGAEVFKDLAAQRHLYSNNGQATQRGRGVCMADVARERILVREQA